METSSDMGPIEARASVQDVFPEERSLQYPPTMDETDPTDTYDSLASPPRIEDLQKPCAKLLRLRNKLLEIRTETQFQWQECEDAWRFCQQSQKTFITLLGESEFIDGSLAPETLSECQRQVETDMRTFQMKISSARDLQSRLSSLESETFEREQAFFNKLEQLLRSNTNADGTPMLSSQWEKIWLAGDDLTPSPVSTSPRLHPLLETFYDKAGDVGVLGEELADLDFEYQQQKVQRGHLVDQERPLSQSDSDFELEYRTARLTIEEKLRDAIEKQEEARSECLRGGLDPKTAAVSIPETSEKIFQDHKLEQQSRLESHVSRSPSRSVAPTQPRQGIPWAWNLFAGQGSTRDPPKSSSTGDDERRESIWDWNMRVEDYVDVSIPRRASSITHLRRRCNEDSIIPYLSPWNTADEAPTNRRRSLA